MGVMAAVEAETKIQWLVVGDSGSGCGGGSAMVVRSCVRWISCEVSVKVERKVGVVKKRTKAAEGNEQRVIAGLIKDELLFSNRVFIDRAVVGP